MKPQKIELLGQGASHRWVRLGFLLLCVYAVVLICSIYIRHNLATEYGQAVARSQEWSQRFRNYSKLGRLLTGVNELEYPDPSEEHLGKLILQIEYIGNEFEQVLGQDQSQLSLDSQEIQAEMILKDLMLVKRSMDELIQNTAKLVEPSSNPEETRKELLPRVSTSFHRILKTFGRLRSRVAGIEAEYFHQQIDAVRMLERLEYLIAFLLFGLVGGVTYYGNRLQSQAKIDLEEKERLLGQVEAADGKYRALFENASEGIFQIDSCGKFIIANPALAAMCGYSSPAEFVEAIQDAGTQFFADPLFWSRFLQEVRTGQALSTLETEVKCRDGSQIWGELDLHAIEEHPGEIAYFEGTLKNITGHKWAELRRTLDYLLPRILAESATVEESLNGVLQTICEILDWEMGVAWEVDKDLLVLSHLYQARNLPHARKSLGVGAEIPAGEEFLAPLRESGVVQSRLLQELENCTCADVRYAAEKHLQRIVVVPVKVNASVSYLLNFFGSKAQAPAPELISLFGEVALQLGHLFERKFADEALRESEALKAAIFESSLDSMITFDAEGNITDFNPAAERTFGYPRQQAIGMQIGRLIIPGSFREIGSERSTSHFNEGVRSGAPGRDRPEGFGEKAILLLGRRVELTAINEEGNEFPVEMSVSQINHNGHKFYTAAVREISDRKRAERVRLELAAVVESSSDAIIRLSPDGNILSWNHGAEVMFEYTAEEAIGRHVYILVPPDRIEECARNLQMIRRGSNLANRATIRLRKGGQRFDVSLTESPIRNSSGAVSGISLIARDITENKLLQEQLLQSQKMEAVGALAGGIAHDFNNILTAIIGYSDLMLRQVSDSVPFYKNIVGIKASAEFAASLTHQLLAFSRRQTLELGVFQVNDSVARIQKLLKRLIGENISILTSLNPEAGRIRADQGQMEQVLMNLAVNARDAMPKGGVLSVETSWVEIEQGEVLTGLAPGSYVKLSVSDTGHGMTPEVREHLFEPFFTTKDKGKGTGLGLATCYGIIKQIGGHILVESAPGEGTTFHLYFPRVPDSEASSKSATSKIATLPRGNEIILLVEDEETVRKLSADVLRRLGYMVIEAADTESAQATLEDRNGEVDLLLSDVVLPNRSGKELGDWAVGKYRNIKVLLMSGYLEDGMLKNHGLTAEDAFLQKPFSPSTLAEKVRTVIDRPVTVQA